MYQEDITDLKWKTEQQVHAHFLNRMTLEIGIVRI